VICSAAPAHTSIATERASTGLRTRDETTRMTIQANPRLTAASARATGSVTRLATGAYRSSSSRLMAGNRTSTRPCAMGRAHLGARPSATHASRRRIGRRDRA